MFFRAAILTAVMLGTGCQSTRFYTQAIGGQWEIISERETITKVIREEPPNSPLTDKLRLVQGIIAFAQTNLALPAERQYQAYVDLKRRYVVWNVEATPEFSLDSKSWWYPVVGSLEYQGYFKKKQAVDYAKRLREEGYDVFVGGVPAYSTLGWFNDAVLSTFVHLPEAELAELIFHELAHQKLFIAGDTDFNEAFATSIGREGVRRWFMSKNNPGALAQFLESRTRDDTVVELILRTRDELERLYESSDSLTENAIRMRKAEIIRKLRTDYDALKKNWPGYSGYDGFMAADINNAQLNAVDTYFHLLPRFDSMIHLVDNHLPAFYEQISQTRKMDKQERRAFLNQQLSLTSAPVELITEDPEEGPVNERRQN